MTIFRCHYVNLTVIKFKTLTDTMFLTKIWKKDQNKNFKNIKDQKHKRSKHKRPKDSGITLKHNGQKVTLNYFKI